MLMEETLLCQQKGTSLANTEEKKSNIIPKKGYMLTEIHKL